MAGSHDSGKYLNRVILLLLALFLFTPPVLSWWVAPGRAWYLPYLLWALLITLGLRLQRRRDAP
jgi:hypothetical protein